MQDHCTREETRYGASVGIAFRFSDQSVYLLNGMGAHQEETFYKSAMSYGDQPGRMSWDVYWKTVEDHWFVKDIGFYTTQITSTGPDSIQHLLLTSHVYFL